MVSRGLLDEDDQTADGVGRVRSRLWLGTTATAMLMIAVILAGCSAKKDESSSAFCMFMSKLNTAANNVTSPNDGLDILKSYEPELERQLYAAPEDMRADIMTILNASKLAIANGDLAALSTDEVADAGARLSTQCKLKPEPGPQTASP